MNYRKNEYSINISYVKENCMRCTVTKDVPVKNDSFLVESAVYEKQQDSVNLPAIFADIDQDNIIWSACGKELLRLIRYSLESVDVIKYSTQGEPPLIEVVKTVDGERTQISNLQPYVDRKAYTGSISIRIPKTTGIFGLGQDEDGVYNHRGTKCYLYQHNMRIPIPFMMTDQGWGILFDCPSLMIFDDTGDETTIWFDTVDQIDFYIITGNMDTIVSEFRYLTGKAVMLPKWAFGYVQCKERYKTQDEMIAVARRYRELGVPLDCIVQDWKSWPGDEWGQKTVDKERYPNLGEMNRTLHGLNVHTMVSIWPNMAAGCPDHMEMAEKGHLLGDYSTYNAFDENAREVYWQQANKELFKRGFDSWWCDSTEPFTAPDWCGETKLPEEKRYELVGGEHKKFLDPTAANLYAVMHAKGIYQNQRKHDDHKRVFNLTRSGYPGIQKYGAVLWAGDTSARWDELKKEIAKGLNMCMSGIPYWTVDIGAFFVGGVECWRKWSGDPNVKPAWFFDGEYDGGVDDPAYCELYTRWLQFGAFLPIFRSHGSGTPREIWNFGKPGEMFYDAIEKYIKLRYRLLPYIYSLAASVRTTGYTMMRSFLFDFSEDGTARNTADEFMFGDAILVCPVTQPMYYDKNGAIESEKRRLCYLPKGTDWFDFWTGELYAGGQTVNANAEIDKIPLFVRAGSILLTQSDVQSAMEGTGVLNVWIYGGSDTERSYYEDDGVSYNYEKGEYELLYFIWNDKQKQLTVCEHKKFRDAPILLNIHYNNKEQRILFDGIGLSIRLYDAERTD
ncbi:MAG: TIM-barrel domain-containing protein [Eubacteriales bacterium]